MSWHWHPLPLLSCPGTTTKPWAVHVLAEPPPRGLLAFLSRSLAHLSREPWDGAAGTQIAGALGGRRQAFCLAAPPPFRALWWAEIDGVVCYPGNPPLARRSGCMLPTRTLQPGALGRSRWHTDCRSLGSEPLAMPGNCFMGSRRRRAR